VDDRDEVFDAAAAATAVLCSIGSLFTRFNCIRYIIITRREKKFDRWRVKSAEAKTTTDLAGVGSKRGKNNMFAKSLCYYYLEYYYFDALTRRSVVITVVVVVSDVKYHRQYIHNNNI